MSLRVLCLVILAACAAEPTWRGSAGEDAWTTPPGLPLRLQVSKLDGPGTITASPLPFGTEAKGPAVPGTPLPVTIDGVACELTVIRRSTAVVDRARSNVEQQRRPNATAGSREIRFVDLSINCGDHAVPGTAASLRGARALPSLAWIAIPLALGIAGGWIGRRKNMHGAGITALAIAAGIVVAVVASEGMFRLTYGLLFGGIALIASFALRGDSWRLRGGTLGGAIAGLVVAPILWPLWNAGGPIAALGFAIGGAAIAAGIAVATEN